MVKLWAWTAYEAASGQRRHRRQLRATFEPSIARGSMPPGSRPGSWIPVLALATIIAMTCPGAATHASGSDAGREDSFRAHRCSTVRVHGPGRGDGAGESRECAGGGGANASGEGADGRGAETVPRVGTNTVKGRVECRDSGGKDGGARLDRPGHPARAVVGGTPKQD